jgi:predicted ArsR family transcriptional regulator
MSETAQTKQIGRPKKDYQRTQIGVTMSPQLKERLENEATEMGLTVSELVRLRVFGTVDSDSQKTVIQEGFPKNWQEYGKRVAKLSTSSLARFSAWAEQLEDEEEAEKRGVHILEYQVRTKGKFASLGNTSDERWAKFKELFPEQAKQAEASKKYD